jgi:hypothetical protein
MHYGITESERTPELLFYLYLHRVYLAVIVILWAKWRGGVPPRRWSGVWLLIALALHVTVSFSIGSRIDMFSLSCGLVVYECHPIAATLRRRRSSIAVIAFLAIPVLYGLLVLQRARAYGEVTGEALMDNVLSPTGLVAKDIIAQDYYWPSHLLFVAQQDNLIMPGEVVKSNLANSLAFMNYPYLTETLGYHATGSSSRLTGFAFQLFIEGWLFASWLGIFYNAIVFNVGAQLKTLFLMLRINYTRSTYIH